MRKVLLLKEKRLWWRLLLPAAMAAMAVMAETAVAHRLKSLGTAAAALPAMAVSRLQNPASD